MESINVSSEIEQEEQKESINESNLIDDDFFEEGLEKNHDTLLK